MKKILFMLMAIAMLASCQDKDIDIAPNKLTRPEAAAISGKLEGDNYVWTWANLASGLKMEVTLVIEGVKTGAKVCDGNTYVHENVDTNIDYQYIFKQTDGTNFSEGVVKSYKRLGAKAIQGLSMSQTEKSGGYDAKVEWQAAEDATSIQLTATNGEKNIEERLDGKATSYVIPDVKVGDTWNVTLVAANNDGAAPATKASLRIGKTAVAFLSLYPTPDELVADGDDDEASAWLWFHSEYPTGEYLWFGDISSQADLDSYRVIFWLRDLESGGEGDLFNLPDVANQALPFITSWYKAGGNLLLWQHAITFITNLGRIPTDAITNNDRAIGIGPGGYNRDTWRMAVQLHPGSKFTVDMSSHPIYKGIEVTMSGDGRTKLIAVKGPGWTEDHNCLFFNYPSQLTGMGNQESGCYNALTETYGIYPLATWDSQIDWVSQLNVWEARQGNTDYKGTVICVGNGGCEFSMKNFSNGEVTPDKSAYPKNNIYQGNVLKMAKNAIEYLKTR